MVSAQSAIVRASPLDRGVVSQRHFRRLDEYLAAAPVVIHIVGDQNTFPPMLHAVLEHEYLVVLKNDLGFALHEAARADGDGNVVEKIRTHALSHAASSKVFEGAQLQLRQTLETNAALARGSKWPHPIEEICYRVCQECIDECNPTRCRERRIIILLAWQCHACAPAGDHDGGLCS